MASLGRAGAAQEPLRAGIVGHPRPGQPSPTLSMPYQTASGAGPADQPFRLAAELGRTVVVVFGPVDPAWWARLVAVCDSAWPQAVLVGVVKAGWSATGSLAGQLGSARLKLLADSVGGVGRRFGVTRGSALGLVIGDDGRVVRAVADFSPADPARVRALSGPVKGVPR